MQKGKDIILSVIDLLDGLWKRSDRDFTKRAARKAFRETCLSLLRGELVEVDEPSDDCPRDSVEWARYVAVSDYEGLGKFLDKTMSMGAVYCAPIGQQYSDESDSDDEEPFGFVPFVLRGRKKKRMLDPSKDKRFKANKSEEQISKMAKDLEFARTKATEVFEANRGLTPTQAVEQEEENIKKELEVKQEELTEESSDVVYGSKRKRNSQPVKVPLPPLPTDYRLENDWVKKNIKSPDMLYSYVRAKAGDGIRWSSGLRRYYESNDFWEFAFDTLSCGGWCDSETNKPICNVAKYITKATIGEFERHEASKHSRFEGKFKSGMELLEYIQVHCGGLSEEVQTEEYCSWFLQKMNEIGWRWSNGSTINNIPGQMTKMLPDFKEWCKSNAENLAGLNPNQYGETLRIQNAIANGDWKPRENGKFCAMDLLKLAKPKN